MKEGTVTTVASAAEGLGQRWRHVHFVGVGGVSMSALAATLRAWGLQVSGSDRAESAVLEELRREGVEVWVGHEAQHLGDADLVVYNTAIAADNPERAAAEAEGREVWHRARLLAEVLSDKRRIAIAGTHGKSSTTSMIATVLGALGQDPTLYVGGVARNFGSNYYLGRGPLAVFEACESDRSFREYVGCSQVITSIEADHLDQHGSLDNLVAAFRDFAATADPEGFLVHAARPRVVAEVAEASPARRVCYAIREPADYWAEDIRKANGGLSFVPVAQGRRLERAQLPCIGDFNVRNALAAIAVADQLGLDLQAAAEALATYRGVGRRFERLGEVEGFEVVDDYAHHPTEVAVTLRAAKEHYGRRLVVIFQPHLYSRTRDFLKEFGEAFGDADVVILADIYAARELPLEGVTSERLYELVQQNHPDKTVVYLPTFEAIVEYVRETALPGDLVLTMGAGDVRQVGESLVRGSA